MMMERVASEDGSPIWFYSKTSAEIARHVIEKRIGKLCRIEECCGDLEDSLPWIYGYCILADRSGITERQWEQAVGAAWASASILEREPEGLLEALA